MTIQDLGSIGEFVSSIIVLGTLIYLVIQVRQSNMMSRAQARQTTISIAQAELFQLVDNPDLVVAMANEPTTDEQRGKLAFWLTSALRQREFDWMQYKDGVIDEETYRTYVGVISLLLGTGHTRRWWRAVGASAFHPGFALEVNQSLESMPLNDFFARSLDWGGPPDSQP
ncbi:MAG: hypothetical protein O7G86_13645 [Gammaproteobacteria bacterium]|nr:hypothetical protein [Gammaproteobacteria bacterium]